MQNSGTLSHLKVTRSANWTKCSNCFNAFCLRSNFVNYMSCCPAIGVTMFSPKAPVDCNWLSHRIASLPWALPAKSLYSFNTLVRASARESVRERLVQLTSKWKLSSFFKEVRHFSEIEIVQDDHTGPTRRSVSIKIYIFHVFRNFSFLLKVNRTSLVPDFRVLFSKWNVYT